MPSLVVTGACVDVMAQLPANSVHAVVTDPPYLLNFMGKDFDSQDGAHADPKKMQEWHERWVREAMRVLRPGGILLAFGGTRTYHRLACALEDVGFEMRDMIAWLYGQGFPKSLNVGVELGHLSATARGTALKPAHEPIAVARKPFVGTVLDNARTHETGVLNIDDGRIMGPQGDGRWSGEDPFVRWREERGDVIGEVGAIDEAQSELGRWPANVVLDEEAAALLDEAVGERASGPNPTRRSADKFQGVYNAFYGGAETPARGADKGGVSRFFYCAKANRGERDAGLAGFDRKMLRWSSGDQAVGTFQSEGTDRLAANHHPTVKPVALMRWLIRLVVPPGGVLLDPFGGSGSTGCAAALEQRAAILVEREPEYVEIARARIAWWEGRAELGDFSGEVPGASRADELEDAGQLSLLS